MANEYILKADGSFVRRPVTLTIEGEQPVFIDDSLSVALTQHVLLKFRNAFTCKRGFPVGVSMRGENYVFCSCDLPGLSMAVAMRPDGEHVIPDFGNTLDGVNLAKLDWEKPVDMRLMLCASFRFAVTSGGSFNYSTDTVYLFCFHQGDVSRVCYLLPIPNLYSDGRVCTGVREGQVRDNGITISGCFEAVMDRFYASSFNTDLLEDNAIPRKEQNCRALLRFKATKDGFETVKPQGHWTAYCARVGSEIVKQVTL